MKIKTVLVILFIIFSIKLLSAQSDYNSLAEIRAENELAERIERSIKPFVDESIVIVDFELKYNLFDALAGDFDIDNSLSLPGLPVGKTANANPNIDLSEFVPTEIIKKTVIIKVPTYIRKKKMAFIEEIANSISSINLMNGDILTVENDLVLKKINTKGFWTTQNIFIITFLLILLLFMNNIKSSAILIAKSMRKVKVSNIDQMSGGKSSIMTSVPTATSSSVSNQPKAPLNVKILKDDDDRSPTSLDFLNELSNAPFLDILENENPNEIAIILSQVSMDKVNYFFKYYKGNKSEIINSILNSSNILKLDMKIMVVDMYQKYMDAMEKDPVKINSVKLLTNFINGASSSTASNIYKILESVNYEIAREVAQKVFLLKDIEKLSSVQIEQINGTFSHLEMVQFLKCAPSFVKNKFFGQLSERASMIIKEDIETLQEVSESERELIIDFSLDQIRTILNYN